MPISRVSQLLLAQRLVQSTVSNRILVLVLEHSLFNFLSVLRAWLSGCQRAEGRAAADTSSCLEAWSGQRLRTQTFGMVQRKSAHFIRKKAVAEWPVIKAVIESSVIFKNWWQWCKLIACIHYLHLISCFLFPTKSFFFFCKARFAC